VIDSACLRSFYPLTRVVFRCRLRRDIRAFEAHFAERQAQRARDMAGKWECRCSTINMLTAAKCSLDICGLPVMPALFSGTPKMHPTLPRCSGLQPRKSSAWLI
jgi:hypothetical protein